MELVTLKQGKQEAHIHRVNTDHKAGDLIYDPEGDIIMQDVIKQIKTGQIDRAIMSLGVYAAKYKETNPFL